MINNNPLPVAEKVAIECNIMNAMRPPSVSEINGECKISGIHFDSILTHRANDSESWRYLENDKRIGFEYKEMRWSNGISINSDINNSIGVVDTESSPISFTYPDALGTGINIKILQDNYKWQKIVEIESLDSLKNIPDDAEYLEISFTLSSDFVLPEGIINECIPFGENSFIQPVKAWDSLQKTLEDEITNGTFGEIKGNVLIKKIPVAWLKSAVYPVQVDTTITYGAENVFNPAITDYTAVAALDSTHFVAAYRDEGNSSFGTAIIGEVSGTTVSSYGAEHVFNSATTSYIRIAALDTTHFVVAYETGGSGTAIIGEVSETTINSYGTEEVFNLATDHLAVTALDATHFVVAYNTLGDGTAIIGEVSGTTISSYGAENVFCSGTPAYISVATIDSTRFIVTYGRGADGAAIIGEFSGTTISSYGAENVFCSEMTEFTTVVILDSTHFVVAYTNLGAGHLGTAIVGEFTGTTISLYGAANVFCLLPTLYISTIAIDSTHFGIVYENAAMGYGATVVGEVSGITIDSYSDENVFNSAYSDYGRVATLDSTHFVIVYRDSGNSQFGTGIVGEVSGITVNPMWYYGMNTGEFNQLEFNVTTIETVQPSTLIAVFIHHYNQMKEN